ncbi:MAG: hypothetical protein ACREHD_12560 [Pirellulales bacterium]
MLALYLSALRFECVVNGSRRDERSGLGGKKDEDIYVLCLHGRKIERGADCSTDGLVLDHTIVDEAIYGVQGSLQCDFSRCGYEISGAAANPTD